MPAEFGVVPHEERHKVIVGTTVRKSANILAAYLRSLAWQEWPANVDPVFVFVADNLDADALELLKSFCSAYGGGIIEGETTDVIDFSDLHPVTHQWAPSAMKRVGRNKDRILDFARHENAAAVWFADADLIMDRTTFISLWSLNEPLACAVYWTRWQRAESSEHASYAGPQVWMAHPYGLAGRGMDEAEFRRTLINRDCLQVYGQGACTLIRRVALTKGVSFAPVPGAPTGGMMEGEDRHFCIRAEQMHLRMVADGWPNIFHIYHRPDDEALIPDMEQRLGVLPTGSPGVGDLVSLELQPVEHIVGPSGPTRIGPQFIRGRVAALKLHPELEEAILSLERGAEAIIPLHFPVDYPFPQYRGQRRIVRVKLIDWKAYGFQPVVEQEIIVAQRGGSYLDATALTPDQHALLREYHIGRDGRD